MHLELTVSDFVVSLYHLNSFPDVPQIILGFCYHICVIWLVALSLTLLTRLASPITCKFLLYRELVLNMATHRGKQLAPYLCLLIGIHYICIIYCTSPSVLNELSITSSSIKLTNHDYEHNEWTDLPKKGLHFLNTRSLLPKLSNIKLISQQTKAATICITKTWIDSTVTDNEIYIEGYNILCCDRDRHGHGGVCIYIRTDITEERWNGNSYQ